MATEQNTPLKTTIDWKGFLADPREVKLDKKTIPPSAYIPGIEGPNVVVLVLTATAYNPTENRWTFTPMLYPKPADRAELEKVLAKDPMLKAFVLEVMAVQEPVIGSRMVFQYQPLADSEVPSTCTFSLDWGAGLRVDKRAQDFEIAQAHQEWVPRRVRVLPAPGFWSELPPFGGVFRKLDIAFNSTWEDEWPPKPAVLDAPRIEVPKVDPWQVAEEKLDTSTRFNAFVGTLKSMHSVLIIRRPGAVDAMRRAGLGHAIHHTVVGNGEINVREHLARGKTFVQLPEGDVEAPASHVVQLAPRNPLLPIGPQGLDGVSDAPIPLNLPKGASRARSGNSPRPLGKPNT